MSDKRRKNDFRYTGLKVYENPNGDVIIADHGRGTGVKMRLLLRWQTWENLEDLGRQFKQFIQRHRDLRSK